MKRYFILIFLIVLTGCKHHILINRSAVKMIKVVRYRDETDSIVMTYTDAVKIRHIANAVNTDKKEPIAFETNCTLHIIYADSTATFLCHGSAIRYKGTTYRLNESIEEILN